MDHKTFDKIKALSDNSLEFETFWSRWRAKCQEPNCDKHSAGFNDDPRFSSFQATLSFDNAYGYYGSSSCNRLMTCDSDLAKTYLVKAVNVHRELIFRTMSELMQKDASALTDKARAEVAAMNDLLDQVDGKLAADAA